MPIPTEFEFTMPVAAPPASYVRLDQLMAACALGMVEAQKALNEEARASWKRWDEHGIPPSALVLRQCRVRFPTRLTVVQIRTSTEHARLQLRPRFAGQAQVTVSYFYVFEPPGE